MITDSFAINCHVTRGKFSESRTHTETESLHFSHSSEYVGLHHSLINVSISLMDYQAWTVGVDTANVRGRIQLPPTHERKTIFHSNSRCSRTMNIYVRSIRKQHFHTVVCRHVSRNFIWECGRYGGQLEATAARSFSCTETPSYPDAL